MDASLGLTAGAAVALVVSWLAARQHRRLADLPTTPAAAVFAGRNEVVGRVWTDAPLVARRTNTQAVAWTWKLEEERERTVTSTTTTDGKTSTSTHQERYWETIETDGAARDRFEVVDDSGSVTVLAPGGHGVRLAGVYNETFREEDNRGFLERLFTSGNRTGRYRETESALAVGATVFCIGFGAIEEDSGAPVLKDGPGANLLVTTGSEHSRTMGWRFLAAAAAVAVLVLMGLAGAQAGKPNSGLGAAIGGTVGLVALGGLASVLMYNRLHIVAQMAERAFSLVEVQLKRRADLIPVLARVAAAAATHERAALEDLTAQRGVAQFASAHAADTELVAQTSSVRRLVAVAEASPELKANTAWLQLMDEVADAENRIAGSRHFYNDSVTTVRSLRRTFPGVLIARFVREPRADLFTIGIDERAVPRLTRTFD